MEYLVIVVLLLLLVQVKDLSTSSTIIHGITDTGWQLPKLSNGCIPCQWLNACSSWFLCIKSVKTQTRPEMKGSNVYFFLHPDQMNQTTDVKHLKPLVEKGTLQKFSAGISGFLYSVVVTENIHSVECGLSQIKGQYWPTGYISKTIYCSNCNRQFHRSACS